MIAQQQKEEEAQAEFARQEAGRRILRDREAARLADLRAATDRDRREKFEAAVAECKRRPLPSKDRLCLRALIEDEVEVTITGGDSQLASTLSAEDPAALRRLQRLRFGSDEDADASKKRRKACPQVGILAGLSKTASVAPQEKHVLEGMICWLAASELDVEAWRAGNPSEVARALRPYEAKLRALEELQGIGDPPMVLITNGPRMGKQIAAGALTYALESIELSELDDGTLAMGITHLVGNAGRGDHYLGTGSELYLLDSDRVMVRDNRLVGYFNRLSSGERGVDLIPPGVRARRTAVFGVTRQQLKAGLTLVVPNTGGGIAAKFGLRYVE